MAFLDYLLGGVSGGFEGYERKKARELQAQKDEEAALRQKRLDEAAIRREQLDAINSGMVRRSAYNPFGMGSRMDMPGATPRQPVFSQNIGGTEFVLPESPDTTKHRADVMKERDARAKRATEQTNLADAFAGVEVAGKPLFGKEQAARVAKLPSNERSSLVSAAIRAATPDRGGKAEIDDDAKRLIGAQYLASNVRNPALMRALNTTYARNPAASLDPELTAYNIMKSKTVPAGITANRGYTPAKPKEGDSLDAAVKAEVERRKGGAAGTPAAKPSTAKKTSVVDNELIEQRKLWDDAVVKHGRDKVIREFGERP